MIRERTWIRASVLVIRAISSVAQVSPGPGGRRPWLFVAQRWLAVDKEDGRVDRTLRACSGGLSFGEVLRPPGNARLRILLFGDSAFVFNSSQMLRLKLRDYLADHHIWMSVLSGPRPHPFTHIQRLGVSLLLLLGHAAANATAVSQLEDQVGEIRLRLSASWVRYPSFSLLRSCPLMWA